MQQTAPQFISVPKAKVEVTILNVIFTIAEVSYFIVLLSIGTTSIVNKVKPEFWESDGRRDASTCNKDLS